MNITLVKCSRCNRDIEGLRDEGYTGGFYDVNGWEKYFDAGETIVCDDCMHWDHRYQKDYGNGIMKNHAPYGFLAQWNNFRLHYPDAKYTLNNNSLNIKFPFFAQISYTENKIAEGWSKDGVEVRFDINVGYPVTKPSGFWIDEGVSHVDGLIRKNIFTMNDTLGNKGFYSMLHFRKWNPNNDSLLTIARTIRRRFAL